MSNSFLGARIKHAAAVPYAAGAGESTLWVNSSDSNKLYLNGNPVSSTPVVNPTVDPDFQGYTQTDQTGDGYISSKALLFNSDSLTYSDSGAERTLALGDTVSKNVAFTGQLTYSGNNTTNFNGTNGKTVLNYTGPIGFGNDNKILEIDNGLVIVDSEGPVNQNATIAFGNPALFANKAVSFSSSYSTAPFQSRVLLSFYGANSDTDVPNHGIIIGDNSRSKNHIFIDDNSVTIHKSNTPMVKIDMANNNIKMVDSNNEQLLNFNMNPADGTITFGTVGSVDSVPARPCSLTFSQSSGWFRLYNNGAPTFQVNAITGYMSCGDGLNNTLVFNGSAGSNADIFTVTNNTISSVAKFAANGVNMVVSAFEHVAQQGRFNQGIIIDTLTYQSQSLFDWIKSQFGL